MQGLWEIKLTHLVPLSKWCKEIETHFVFQMVNKSILVRQYRDSEDTRRVSSLCKLIQCVEVHCAEVLVQQDAESCHDFDVIVLQCDDLGICCRA